MKHKFEKSPSGAILKLTVEYKYDKYGRIKEGTNNSSAWALAKNAGHDIKEMIDAGTGVAINHEKHLLKNTWTYKLHDPQPAPIKKPRTKTIKKTKE
jgi:hypothetical protein